MIKRCCFAGHREIQNSNDIQDKLDVLIEKLITEENVSEFWVGNYGTFDRISAGAVRRAKQKYSHIELDIVIPYLTLEIEENKEFYYKNYDNIIVADIPYGVPRKCRILKCNEYMVEKSDFIICCVQFTWGGAAKTMEYVKKQKHIKILNLQEI